MSKRDSKGRRSRKEIEEHVAAWRASGLTVSEFAKKHDLPRSNLYQWVHARTRKANPTEKPNAEAAFVEVVASPSSTAVPLTLEAASGLTMKVDAARLEPKTLRVLIEAMRGC